MRRQYKSSNKAHATSESVSELLVLKLDFEKLGLKVMRVVRLLRASIYVFAEVTEQPQYLRMGQYRERGLFVPFAIHDHTPYEKKFKNTYYKYGKTHRLI